LLLSTSLQLQHWEGDWSIRGNYNASSVPSATAVAGMQAWLTARQAGVSAARAAVGASGVAVYHAAEVNLVMTTIESNFPNVVNTVLPSVALDLVSYSSYDTMSSAQYFPQALATIAKYMKQTPASDFGHDSTGLQRVYVGEFGTPMNQVCQTAEY
jgi:hypothetical protein